MDHRQQIAALPVRHNGDGSAAILLITSRETRRWVIPKGWPIKGKSHPDAAAIEAWEEAGIKGKIAPYPVGAYTYEKRRRKDWIKIEVSVYVMEVASEHNKWPERKERKRTWFTATDAAAAVQELGLKRSFAG